MFIKDHNVVSVSFNRNSFTLTRKQHTMKEKGKYPSHGIHVDFTDSEIFIINIKGERKQSDDMKTVFFLFSKTRYEMSKTVVC